ncbi:MAG TPA: hypothetical protein VM940_14480 [Chthoniobacterales bacterium]|jgi:hypothetical protein|nr:hypothetical protein [Chthoniobacterales bacterium]
MTKSIKKSEASKTAPITIQLTGFTSVEQAKKVLLAIVKPELHAGLTEDCMTLDKGVFSVSQIICCRDDESGFGLCSSSPISEICQEIGSGCPLVHVTE